MSAIFQTTFSNTFSSMKISLKISLKFVPKVRINNIPSLIQIMAWCRPGDKSLSETMMVAFGANVLALVVVADKSHLQVETMPYELVFF